MSSVDETNHICLKIVDERVLATKFNCKATSHKCQECPSLFGFHRMQSEYTTNNLIDY